MNACDAAKSVLKDEEWYRDKENEEI